MAWRLYHGGERYLKAALPTYSFEPTACWLNPMASMYVRPSAEQVQAAQAALTNDAHLFDDDVGMDDEIPPREAALWWHTATCVLLLSKGNRWGSTPMGEHF